MVGEQGQGGVSGRGRQIDALPGERRVGRRREGAAGGVAAGADQTATLYDGTYESENCGVGLIASLKSVPSSRIIQQADEMLVRMSHRGGVGSDPASGDGSGKSGNCVIRSLNCAWE